MGLEREVTVTVPDRQVQCKASRSFDQAADFYDKTLNKDFVEFTGHSPSDYLRLRRFHVENPNHSLDVAPLTVD